MELPPNALEYFATLDVLTFLDAYKITNDQGQILDFKNHPYLLDIYSDFSNKMCIKKCAQVGISTTIVLKALWAAKNLGLDIIYSFPTYDLSNKMVSSKVNRLIANNKILQEWVRDKDAVEQKRVGSNMLYFQGTSNEQAAIALPADLYIADEVDRSDAKNVELFSSRLQHSRFAWEWRFSNPSVPDNGVDKWWAVSDQKEWFVNCDHCGRDQILTMDSIRSNMFVCSKCGKELDRTRGRWIKKWNDDSLMSGYHISTLMSPQMSAEKILQEQKTKPEQQFTNMILGEPYVGHGNYLSRSVLVNALDARDNPQDTPMVIGVDTGKRIHFVVGNKYGLFYNAEAQDYSVIRKILSDHPNAIAVIDQGGDITAPRELQEQFSGRVYLCAFVSSQDVAPRWREDKQFVNVDRDKAIQLVVDEFNDGRMKLFGIEDNWSMYMDHWSHVYREIDEDARGRRKYTWKRNGPDHLALATLYWRLGMDKVEGGEGELIQPHSNLWGSVGRETNGTLPRLKLS